MSVRPMQPQQHAEQKEVSNEFFASLDIFFFVAAHRSHFGELGDIIQQHEMLSRMMKKPKTQKERKRKKTKSVDEHEDVEKKRTVLSFGYALRNLRDSYAQAAFFSQQPRVDIYELHYGSALPARFVKEEEDYQSDTVSMAREVQHIEEENPEKMNQTIQHIINAKLFGTLSDISAEEKEKFKNWREFNKHLRRFYEGAHYWSSITKFI